MIALQLKLLKKTKINGITFFPFIFLRDKRLRNNKVLMNHEKIHIYQQLELLIIFFYIWYVVEYYYWYIKLKDKNLAYHHICFEREAYTQEQNLNYLKHRKIWSFWKYKI